MNDVSPGNVYREEIAAGQSYMLWIQREQRIVHFSPMEEFEKKKFKSRTELIEYAKACINAGYHIG